MITAVLYAAGTLLGLALLGGVLLVAAARLLAVEEDPRTAQAQACLPGVNCGACGYAGCAAYARALTKGEAGPGRCIPGGQATADALAALLGLEQVQAAAPRKAVVACQGSADKRGFFYRYEGIASCAAVNQFYSGPTDCRYGCLGYGDCTRACPFGAIHVENGVARVDAAACTGCGLCAEACPDHLIRVVPQSEAPMVFCANRERGAVTRKHCSIGCIGCGACVRCCPAGAVTVKDHLAFIDMQRCTGCGACVQQCPVHAIDLAPGAPAAAAVPAQV